MYISSIVAFTLLTIILVNVYRVVLTKKPEKKTKYLSLVIIMFVLVNVCQYFVDKYFEIEGYPGLIFVAAISLFSVSYVIRVHRKHLS